FQKRLDQFIHESRAYKGVVHWAEQHSVRARRQTAQRRVNRTELAFLPFRIHDNFVALERYLLEDGPGIGSEHHATHSDFRMADDVQQVFEERPALVGQQGFGRAHPARGAAREDDGGEHAGLSRRSADQRELTVSRRSTWIFLCDPGCAFLRTATSSAVILTAISSGESAPISRPIGA